MSEDSPQLCGVPSSSDIESAITCWMDPNRVKIRNTHTSANTTIELWDGCTKTFLRLMPLSWRGQADADAELSFVRHLADAGCKVAMPVPTIAGRWAEIIDGWSVVLFEAAPGHQVVPGETDWGEDMFRAWGAALAHQHLVAQGFEFPHSTWRQDWRLDPALVRGLGLLEDLDTEAYACSQHILENLDLQLDALGPLGIAHADFAPQNFRWSSTGGLTAFDFDNCCMHWLLYDLVVAQSFLAKFDKADTWMRAILAGYATKAELPGDLKHVGVLAHLRLLYVLCDRLCTSTPAQIGVFPENLHSLRARFIRTIKQPG